MTNYNGLTQKDLELIERAIYKNGDDIAVPIARSFERLEERIDASESRLYSRLGGFSCFGSAEGVGLPDPQPLPDFPPRGIAAKNTHSENV
jgi:hypothetical protein